MAGEIKNIYGTSTTVISRTSDLADDNIATFDTEWVNTKAYPRALCTFHTPDGFTGGAWATATGNDGPQMTVYGIQTDVDGTDDDTPVPTATGDTVHASRWAEIPISDESTPGTEQRRTKTINMEGIKGAKFYLRNQTGRSVDYNATAITLKITPFTFGPA